LFADSFSDWYDEKVTLPVLEDLPPPEQPTTMLPFTTLLPIAVEPQMKGEYVLDFAIGQLTPPQSPPNSNGAPSIVYVDEASFMALQPTTVDLIPDPYVIAPNQPDLEKEMAMVDDVVRGAAQEFEQWDTSDSNSRSSDGTEDSDDPEWGPPELPAKQTTRRGRQPRPYNPEDRRMRKKEQNKNAATRYRQKKKAEVGGIVEEERELETQNNNLQTKVTDLQREISYLKGLMREMFRAKKLIQ